MLVAQNLKKSFWAKAVANAVYTLNRFPTKASISVTPEDIWSGVMLCVAHLRVFGSLAHAMDANEKKFSAKRTKCIFLGYCKGTEVAYRLMCLETKKIIKNRDVVFMEDSGNINNDLDMRPNGRDGGRTIIVMDDTSKSPLLDGEERANMAISEDPLSWNETIKIDMKELMSNVRSSLHRMVHMIVQC